MAHLDYRNTENQKRQEKYKKDMEIENSIERMNRLLMEAERKEYKCIPDNEAKPLIFVLGLPRSGTTLLVQLLIAGLDIGYIDNLIARFWLAPLHGIRLSKAVLEGNRAFSFRSDYGKTGEISGPHEFSYFWHHWFKMENMPPYLPEEAGEKIDWEGFKRVLRNMALHFAKPLVLKAPDAGYHLKRAAELLPEIFFILIRRDPADAAVSLRQGGFNYYGDYDTWFSMYPVNYDEIKNLPPFERVARQVDALERMFIDGLKLLPARRYLQVGLETLCKEPGAVLRTVCEKMQEYYCCKLELSQLIPREFTFSTYKDTGDYKTFNTILSKLDRI